MSRSTASDDRVLRYTRWLSAAIVPFLVGAFVILYGFPRHTGRLFAWPIAPPMTSMVLASAYLGGVYFFVRVQRTQSWTQIKSGYPPVALFAALLGVATGLHWDRFSHGNVTFWVWTVLYVVAPPLVVLAWLLNSRHGRPPAPADVRIGPAVRAVMALVGAIALIQGLALFVAPELMLPLWPWALTPLTARVIGAVLCLGLAGVLVAADGRWSAAQLLLEVELVMVVFIAIAAVRSRHSFDATRPLTWILAVGFAALLAGSAAYYLTQRFRPGQRTARPGRMRA